MAKTVRALIKAHMVLTITIWSFSPALVFEAADLLKSGSSFFCTKLGLQRQVTNQMSNECQKINHTQITIFRKTSYTSLFVQTISFPNHQQFFDKVKISLINRFRNRNTSLVCWSRIGIM